MTKDQISNIEHKIAFGIGSAMIAYFQSQPTTTLTAPLTYFGGLLILWSGIKSHQMNTDATATATVTVTKLVPLILLTGFLWSGCSTSDITTAYKTETAVDATVTTGWSLWQVYVKANPGISTNTEAQVAAAFQKVQAAEIVAIDATTTLAASTNNTSAVSIYTTALEVMNQDLTDLETLLATFNIKL